MLLLEAPAVAHQVEGPTFDLVVGAGEVLADDAERDQLHAAKEQHRDHQRGITGDVNAAGELQDREKHRVEKRRERDEQPEVAPHLKRHRAERSYPVEGEVPQLPIAPLGATGAALFAIEDDRSLAKADPGEQSLHEARALGEPDNHVNHAAIEQAEVAGIARDGEIREALEDAIEVFRADPFEETVTVAAAAGSIDDIVA